MQDSLSAKQFLHELREENGKRIWSLKTFNRYLDGKAREMGFPLTGQFELTPLCNFNCRMCYVHLNADQLNGQSLLSVETWKDVMLQAREEGMLHVTLSGGECLTYPGFEELYLYLLSIGCDVSILTNGYLLDDKRIAFFQQYRPQMIQISLYGWNDDVYERVTGVRAFSTVWQNIQKVIEAGFYVKLIVTPNKYLGEDALETMRIARSITKEAFTNNGIIAPREETGRSKQRDASETDLLVRLYQYMRKLEGLETKEIDPEKLPPTGGPNHVCSECGLKCGGGRSGFTVDWKGNMMPCNSLGMIHADILKVGFKEAWKQLRQGVQNWPCVPECEGCAYSDICHRCAGIMVQYAEPGKQPIEMCEQIRYFVQHGLMQIPECN